MYFNETEEIYEKFKMGYFNNPIDPSSPAIKVKSVANVDMDSLQNEKCCNLF